jgi:hypothetical protein
VSASPPSSKPDPKLEARIDDLYRGPLAEFVAARTALAKSLAGDSAKEDAKRVKALPKPTVVPWAVNQVFWHARRIFDRLIKSGEQLRTAQVAALEGRKADVRAATEAHREAVAEAVQQAERLAVGVHPSTDALMRTFEALSLKPDTGEAPGRLTKPLQPAGFEALAGVKVAAPRAPAAPAKSPAAQRKEEAARKQAEAAQKKHEAEIKRAEAALERAKKKMADARAALEQARER